MDGAFEYKNPRQFLGKLEDDFQRIEDDPRDQNAAMDFFVTAESLCDWVHPGRSGKAAREALKNQELLLQITSHIASSIKHFKVESKHHTTVKDSDLVGGTFSANTFAAWSFRSSIFSRGGLIIELNGKAAQKYGDRISATELAEMVLDYWKNFIDSHYPTPPST